MYLNWDSTLATGINIIDNQHKELFNRLNQFLISMKEGKSKEEVIKTLDFLEIYVVKHFNEEEEIQKKNNYPKIDIQHKQHEGFKDELKQLRNNYEAKGESVLLALNIQGKMNNWWRNHIITLDKDLGEFL